MAVEGYCVKCKAKRVMKDPVTGSTKNGKPLTKGVCPACGSTICLIGVVRAVEEVPVVSENPRNDSVKS